MAAGRPALTWGLAQAIGAVAVLHGVLLWLLWLASAPRPAFFTAEPPRMRAVRVVVPPAPPAAPPARPGAKALPPRTVSAPRPTRPQVARRAVEPPPSAVIGPQAGTPAPVPGPLPMPAASSPVSRAAPLRMQLDRQALRALDRSPQSAAGLIARDARSPSQGVGSQMAAGMASAARGDCLRGQFKGQGMGLLSLPMLALAYAKQECSSR